MRHGPVHSFAPPVRIPFSRDRITRPTNGNPPVSTVACQPATVARTPAVAVRTPAAAARRAPAAADRVRETAAGPAPTVAPLTDAFPIESGGSYTLRYRVKGYATYEVKIGQAVEPYAALASVVS